MKTLRNLAIFCSLALATSLTAFARPANCTKATAADAVLCASPELKTLDSKMSDAFNQLVKGPQRAVVRELQRVWLRERPGSLELGDAYKQQIVLLHQWAEDKGMPASGDLARYGVYAAKNDVCHYGDRPRPKNLTDDSVDCEVFLAHVALLPQPFGRVRVSVQTFGNHSPRVCAFDTVGQWTSDSMVEAEVESGGEGEPYHLKVTLKGLKLSAKLYSKGKLETNPDFICSQAIDFEVDNFTKTTASKVYTSE